MLLKASAIVDCSIRATDGEIGSVSDLLFEDDTWAVRWLVVDTGTWLTGRKVLLPASHLGTLDPDAAAISIDITRQQVKDSPATDADSPVSRQMEGALYDYYGWAPYWPMAGAYVPPIGYAGAGLGYPLTGVPPGRAVVGSPPNTPGREPSGDPHLRSAREVTGYDIRAVDGGIGHVEDLIADDQGWAIRYIIVDTKNWWPGKQVLIAPSWIEAIDWGGQTVEIGRTRQEIKDAPEYDPTRPVARDYEEDLHRHYRAPGYWASVP